MRLLDTNILGDLIRRPQGAAARRLGAVGDADVATSLVSAGELRYGAAKRAAPHLSKRVEAILTAIPVLELNDAVSTAYGEIRAELEKAGQIIGGNDLWIAAHAQAVGAILVTDNVREFQRVAGLTVENWLDA